MQCRTRGIPILPSSNDRPCTPGASLAAVVAVMALERPSSNLQDLQSVIGPEQRRVRSRGLRTRPWPAGVARDGDGAAEGVPGGADHHRPLDRAWVLLRLRPAHPHQLGRLESRQEGDGQNNQGRPALHLRRGAPAPSQSLREAIA